MLANRKEESLLNRILNVQRNEWHRIVVAWLLRFFYRTGFVIGWTLIIALFVGHFGISALPYLFVLNAFFIILGTFFYTTILERYSTKWLIVSTTLVAIGILFTALYVVDLSQILFFGLLLVAEAVFLGQLRIFLIGYVEDSFSPSESERTFPLIEASETIGGILAGGLIVIFADVLGISGLIYVWILSLLLMLPLVIFGKLGRQKVQTVEEKEIKVNSRGFVNKWRKALSDKTRAPFIRGLFLIVFINWILFNLLEFQYTQAVYDNISGAILEAGSGFENIFVHDLGELFVVFSSAALIMQIFLASRLIKNLGVVGTMLLHPIVAILSLFGLTTSFTFWTAVMMKTNFTVTAVAHHDAYHTSYYAVRRNVREFMHELGEGFVRPLGAIAGTVILIFLHAVLQGPGLIFGVNLAMVFISLILLYATYVQQKDYTAVSISNLLAVSDKRTRFEAVDILSQRGHKKVIPVLMKVLLDKGEPLSLRVRILEAFGQLQDVSTIDEILDLLNAKESALRSAAISALSSFEFFGKSNKQLLIVEGKIVKALKELYEREEDEELRSQVLVLFSRLSPVLVTDFLLKTLDTAKGSLKADAIFALGNFDDDVAIDYLKPFLEARSLQYRINAAIALGKHGAMLVDVRRLIREFLNSEDSRKIALALFAIGELGMNKRVKACVKFMEHKSLQVRVESALALVKMNRREAVSMIMDLLFQADDVISKKVQRVLKSVNGSVAKKIQKKVEAMTHKRISNLIKDVESLEEVPENDLFDLKRMYVLAEAYEEVENVSQFIKS